jgi:hypothetical protein
VRIDEEAVASSWDALGSFIARNLRAGKGVQIAKLGIFTFTPSEIDYTVLALYSKLGYN